ncbi:hypothetical protein N7486_005041 [Penicillium sp. IBT 16267x]|nr:hypothetical protein N7486_005041 [Penicillium sp. IBT 16267x]
MTRVILLNYTETKTLQRGFLDAVGLKFDINPLFMCNHLRNGLPEATRARWDADGFSNYSRIPSQNISLELGHLNFLHASILFLDESMDNEDQKSTVLILLRTSHRQCQSGALELDKPSIYSPTGSLRRIGSCGAFPDRYCAIIEGWSSQHISVANQSPVEFIHPISQLFALEINEHMRGSTARWKDDEVVSLLRLPEAAFKLKSLDYDFRASLYRISSEMDIQALKMTIDALRSPSTRQVRGIQSLLASERWCDLLHDYEHMLKEAKQNSDDFEAYETRCMNRFSFVASTKSVEESESVGRISTLAFVFIPLSFITSFFGMNLVMFGSGDVKLWVFILSSTVLVLLVFIVWSLSAWVAGHIADLQENLYGLKIRTRVLRRLAVISPSEFSLTSLLCT